MGRKDVIIILSLLALVLIFFRGLLNPDKIFLGGDTVIFYPLREFWVNSVKKGIFPLWNPHTFCGSPSASNTTIFGMFYPLSIIFLFLPLHLAFNYSVIMHIFLSGVFMYILAKSLALDRFSCFVSAVTFIFSAAFIIFLPVGAIDLLIGITWVPLIFYLFDKALKHSASGYTYSILTGLTIGLQGLGGHPQMSLMTIYVLFFYFLYYFFAAGLPKKMQQPGRNSGLFRAFGITLFVGTGLYAIQILPSVEAFLKYSTRSFNMDYKSVAHCSLPLKELFMFLAPNLFDNPITGYYLGRGLHFEELCRYIGIFPLFLSLIAILIAKNNRYIKFYSGLLIISILLALGSYGPIHRFCYYLLPGFRAFRWPARWLFFSTFSLSILAGFGLSFLTGKLKYKQNLKFLINGLLFLDILIITILFIDYCTKIDIVSQFAKWVTVSSSKEVDFQYRCSIVKDSLFNFTLLLTAVLVCVFAFYKRKIRPLLFNILTLFIIIFDLWFFGHRFIITQGKDSYLNSRQWDFFKNDRDFYRIFIEPPINDYSASAHGYSVFVGEAPDYELITYNIFKQKIKKFPQMLNAKYYLTTKFTDAKDVKFIKATKTTIFDLFNFKRYRVYESPINIYQYKDFLPRVFIVRNIIIAKDEEEVFRLLNDASFNPREAAVLEGEGFFLQMPPEAKGLDRDSVEIVSYSPNYIKLNTYLQRAGLLVLNEIYFPGWQAYIDGKKEHIFKANYIMRSVYLKEGRHTAEFKYSPLSFRTGAIITILTLLILLFLGVRQGYVAFGKKLSSR